VTGTHVHCDTGRPNISDTVQDSYGMLLLQTTNRKSHIAYRIAAIPMTLSNLTFKVIHLLQVFSDTIRYGLVGWLEFNVPFQHKYGYIRHDTIR